MTRYEYDTIDGRRVPPLVVTEDGDLPEHRGTIHVEGARVTLVGVHQGTLGLHDGAEVTIKGDLRGTAHLDPWCTVRVRGVLSGSAHVSRGAELFVESSGSHRGSVHNEGTYVLDGERGGTLTGRGRYVENPGSVVRRPQVLGDTLTYIW